MQLVGYASQNLHEVVVFTRPVWNAQGEYVYSDIDTTVAMEYQVPPLARYGDHALLRILCQKPSHSLFFGDTYTFADVPWKF